MEGVWKVRTTKGAALGTLALSLLSLHSVCQQPGCASDVRFSEVEAWVVQHLCLRLLRRCRLAWAALHQP